MTVVKEENYKAEEFVYFFLRGKQLPFFHSYFQSVFKTSIIDEYYNNLENGLKPYEEYLSPNNVIDPKESNQNEWFDLSDDTIAINVKYGYESSANARIRDLTREAVGELNQFIVSNAIFSVEHIKDYIELRNKFLHNISQRVKNKDFPIQILKHEEEYIKLAYLICMNFIGDRVQNRLVLFVKFMFNGNVSVFPSHYPNIDFDYRNFIDNVSVKFANNTKSDPHKKTVQFFINELPIGFFELRSNKRVMLHLRQSEGHWTNLMNFLNR